MVKNLKKLVCCALGFALTVLSLACGSTGPYISNESNLEIDLLPSPIHKFTYVNVNRDGKGVSLHCKVDHPQGFLTAEGHVDLAVLDSRGSVLVMESLPIVNHGGRRQRWQDASFRTRLPPQAVQGSRIRLSFHTSPSPDGRNFNCGSNLASGNGQE